MRELTEREAGQVRGGGLPMTAGLGALAGAVSGAGGYFIDLAASGGEFDLGDFAGETIGGAATGAVTGSGLGLIAKGLAGTKGAITAGVPITSAGVVGEITRRISGGHRLVIQQPYYRR